LAEKNIELYQDEVDYIIETADNKLMHKKILSFGLIEYVVTSIQRYSFYLRSINTSDPAGMCIIVAEDVILCATYKNNHHSGFATQAIPYIIEKAKEIEAFQ